ncbi:hypothetical protein [Variovorax sp. UC122_21]|uniref:hypothetical protein n=1 Tax=Variovorax sp. UC122_21 TaxID=3374554 RepID=UPI003757D574
MSVNHDYFGHDTLTAIGVGRGRRAWRRWGLMDHTGPFFTLHDLGYPFQRYTYLPLSLMELLYERFRVANPSGVTLTDDDMFEKTVAGDRYSEQKMSDMYDRREAFFRIDVEESWKGYPYVRPYLPELHEPDTVERLANDPWLDLQLLEWAEFLGPDRGGIPHDLWVDRSARWSPEWRVFCDRLTPADWSPENGWKESTRCPESKFHQYRNEKKPYWITS